MNELNNKCDLKNEYRMNNENGEPNYCFGSIDERSIRDDYKRLTRDLINKNLTITTMESATSGLIASLITDTEGSSAIMPGAFVTYSNEAKIKQGVSAEVIDTYTVYSRETAGAMAMACKDAYNTALSVGVTGTFGNVDPSNEAASIPGLVYFAICTPSGQIRTYQIKLEPQSSRWNYKLAVANAVCKELQKLIEN